MTDYAARAVSDLKTSRDVFDRALADPSFIEQVARATRLATGALRAGKKILFAGNGGSAADAQHLAGELVSRFYYDRPAAAGIALTVDPSVLTAIGNDYGYEHVFERQVQGLGRPGDVLVRVPSDQTAFVQQVHIAVGHIICAAAEDEAVG